MIAVIFEAWPRTDQYQRYLDLAAELRPLLADLEGFISIERFQSLSEPGKLLSLSFWRDEDSIQRWRQLEQHRMAQAAGRTQVFEDYRLRIAHVLRDYSLTERSEAPADSRKVHS
ncbi:MULTISPECIES: antibiotic biosynthesis monooxygenase family protein [Pseudomonas]|jgi:heme-degrading monooxygenase HmoA|uniref:antibiotic biosynthesis monooxygenase family protein n=1 Tax=Pseudomonas TaxID=286 RepID=UPI000288C6F0|nr:MULTISPECIES: antibiotic biosynthesis monooxygenase [Pseudomonas]AMB80526.1 antibiotic biosynthesis monooxygenase [Pseudomonas fragi]NBF16639.1 antibiotic biosynthesis monooxygenase [Pseudomonas sp. Fl4BN2]NNG61183.1 antibiotic biosynthesis monooxygenase [Pseudomonas sp. GC01]AUB76257.1 antibiotic biosynthesis monooxygenase [Pseudomonas sp. Lz4W]NBG93499.1 antibiotic biosynthesis monooxygenase [Pseudomonas sp. 9.1(2019)]